MADQGDKKEFRTPGPAVRGKPARVLLADSHSMVRDAIVCLLAQQKDMFCCATAATVEQTHCQVARHRPDLLVLDLQMQMRHGGGVELITSLRTQFPQIPILALSLDAEPQHAQSALRAGADGFLDKWRASDELLEAIRTVLSGQVYCRMQQ